MWSTSVFVVFNSWNSSSLQGKILIYELSPFYRTWGDLEEISKYDIILLWKLKKKYEITQIVLLLIFIFPYCFMVKTLELE
jgi:hypothetical protein